MLGSDLNNPAMQHNPMMQAIQNSPAYAAWLKLSIILGIFVTIALLVAGIGLLKLNLRLNRSKYKFRHYRRSPTSFVPSAEDAMPLQYGTLLVTQVFPESVEVQIGPGVTPPAAAASLLPSAEHAIAAGAIGGAIGGMFGGCLGIIYPVLLLIFMLRSNVTAAFRPQSTEGFQPPASP